MNLFWECHQQRRIDEANRQSNAAHFTAREARNEVRKLRNQCDTLLLACESLWTLLRDKLDISEEEFLQRINEVDQTDGQLDGCVRKPPAECPACHRNSPARLAQCMYCGAPLQRDPFAS